jgi:hypothetical protein
MRSASDLQEAGTTVSSRPDRRAYVGRPYPDLSPLSAEVTEE